MVHGRGSCERIGVPPGERFTPAPQWCSRHFGIADQRTIAALCSSRALDVGPQRLQNTRRVTPGTVQRYGPSQSSEHPASDTGHGTKVRPFAGVRCGILVRWVEQPNGMHLGYPYRRSGEHSCWQVRSALPSGRAGVRFGSVQAKGILWTVNAPGAQVSRKAQPLAQPPQHAHRSPPVRNGCPRGVGFHVNGDQWQQPQTVQGGQRLFCAPHQLALRVGPSEQAPPPLYDGTEGDRSVRVHGVDADKDVAARALACVGFQMAIARHMIGERS